jgi:hypothetical protein
MQVLATAAASWLVFLVLIWSLTLLQPLDLRLSCSHDFEQHKKWENSASQDRQCSKPQGQRFAAATEWQQQHQRQRSQQAAEEDEKQVRRLIFAAAAAAVGIAACVAASSSSCGAVVCVNDGLCSSIH